MKKDEKEQLYALVTEADAWLNGYRTPGNGMPAFSDDPEGVAAQAFAQEAFSEGSSSEAYAGAAPHMAASGSSGAPAKCEFASISDIAEQVRACSACPLGRTRKNAVPGIGSERPLVLVIGEGPGADEDATGEPFVGKAGKLLDKMLLAIQLSRNTNCFIANVVKCRPPQNRDPAPEESAACARFIQGQIALLKPRLILAVGRIAAQNILRTTEGITRIRGKFFDYNGIPLMPTYHPSALLRNEELKRPAWEDLKTFKAKLLELAPGYDTGNGGQ